MDERDEALLRQAYAAFNVRDIDAVIALMDPDGDWPNAIDGGRVRGHDGVRAHWARQFTVINSTATPLALRPKTTAGSRSLSTRSSGA